MHGRHRMFLAALALAGCSSPTGPEDWVRIAFIATDESGPDVQVPGEVTSGEEFMVRVRTWGVSGCAEKGSSEVVVDGLMAVVVPADRHATGGPCHRMWVSFVHEVPVMLERSLGGDGVVVVRGRRLGRDSVELNVVAPVHVRLP